MKPNSRFIDSLVDSAKYSNSIVSSLNTIFFVSKNLTETFSFSLFTNFINKRHLVMISFRYNNCKQLINQYPSTNVNKKRIQNSIHREPIMYYNRTLLIIGVGSNDNNLHGYEIK